MSSPENASSMSSAEMLSSFMDGEMNHSAGTFFARRLSQDQDLSQTWSRWHLVRQQLRDGGNAPLAFDLADRVSAALAEEMPVAAPAAAQGWGRRLMRPVASAGIAATVAMAAIVGVNQYRSGDTVTLPADHLAAVPAANVDSRNDSAALADNTPRIEMSSPAVPLPITTVGYTEQDTTDRLARARLNSYLMRHNQRAGWNSRVGFVSFVPATLTAHQNSNDAAPQPPLLDQRSAPAADTTATQQALPEEARE
ncbi:MAG: hypothetical protein Tsb002_24610 [Wenzhouxiangellaceae bacterium]